MPDKDLVDFPKQVALVHDWFSTRSHGGAELVTREIDSLLLHLGCSTQLASLVDGQSTQLDSWLYGRSVLTTPIQNLPWGRSHVQQYLPLLPLAIEQLDLVDYPLVISSSHLVAKGVITSPENLHVSYVHTPMRYAWDLMHAYLRRSHLARLGAGPLIRWQLHNLRQWDQLSGLRVDHLIANSRFTARRIAAFWGRAAKVIHPPVEVQRFCWNEPREDFYLCVSRLVSYKRVDLVVEAFNRLKLPLVVVGQGPEEGYLKKLAGPTVRLVGFQPEQEVETLMAHCRAYVYAGLEDFGIAPVEAMASGAPVIGLGRGGLLDTVRCASADGALPTGVLFPDQTVGSIIQALSWFEESRLWKKFSSESTRLWAEQFRPEQFASRLETELRRVWGLHRKDCDVGASDPAKFLGFQV
ncbi:glycosyltransferase [Prochlorococcus sp. MIT 1300]|uniref:glycosyltransferase n=1 Tax=Prochlorococcus sp. MIT 1300 TaxID=3096218 RepID=UPI002A7641F9|nr:glycosyltransferase [Prochlorococcus sp. MIT 1300]